jgi:transcriptional regulator with XRE-family HTH domain
LTGNLKKMSTGNRIKDLRKKAKLNQTELGEKIGLGYGGVAAIEQGRSNPSSEIIIKLAEIFRVSTDYLLLGVETEQTLSESEKEIIEALREDKAMSNAMIEFAKLKKKVINYARNYKQTHAEAA